MTFGALHMSSVKSFTIFLRARLGSQRASTTWTSQSIPFNEQFTDLTSLLTILVSSIRLKITSVLWSSCPIANADVLARHCLALYLILRKIITTYLLKVDLSFYDIFLLVDNI